MYKKIIFVLCVFGTQFSALSDQVEKKLDVTLVSKAPLIDGSLDDECWREAPLRKDFHLLGTRGKQSVAETKMKVAADDSMLYLAFDCEEEEGYKPKITCKEHKNIAVQDDSVEIFISPKAGSNSYMQFMLGAGGGWFEKKTNGKLKDPDWKAPWKHAVARKEKGWTAEIAIPLYLLGSPLQTIGFNAARNRKGSQKEYLTWAILGKSFHEPQNFGLITGFEGRKTIPVLAPQIIKASALQYNIKDDAFSYTLICTVINEGGKGGKTVLKVEEHSGHNTQPRYHTKEIIVAPQGKEEIKWDVPIDSLTLRSARVCVADEENPVWTDVEAISNLCPVKAFTNRNYYTSEEEGQIVCLSIFSDKQASQNEFTLGIDLKDDVGESVFQDKISLSKHRDIVPFPVGKLTPGNYTAVISMSDTQGKEIAQTSIPVIKYRPAPSNVIESKFDQIDQIILLDDKPFFPRGFMITDGVWTEETLKKLRDIGVNTFVRWANLIGGAKKEDIPAIKKQLDLAHAYGIKVIFPVLALGPYFTYLNYTPKMKPAILEGVALVVKTFKDHPAVIGYYGMDEPQPDFYEIAEGIYDIVHKEDPYHFLYSSNFGDWVPHSYKFFDLLGRHGYWMPDISYSPNKLARRCVAMRELANRFHQPFMATPQGCWREESRKLTPQEERVSYFLPLIQGAKGLIPFIYRSRTLHPAEWKIFERIFPEITKLTPILLSKTPPQNIVCNLSAASEKAALPPGPAAALTDFKPLIQASKSIKMPVIQALVKNCPDGGKVIIAANSENLSNQVVFSSSIIESGTKITDFFNPEKEYKRDGNSFSDDFKGYDVKVYRVTGGSPENQAKAVRMSINVIKKEEKMVSTFSENSNILSETDSDFENGNYSDNWKVSEGADCEISAEAPLRGKQCLKITLNDKQTRIVLDKVPLKADTRYVFGGSFRTDIKQAQKTPQYMILVPREFKKIPRSIINIPMREEWKEYKREFTTREAVKARITLVIPPGKGTVSCDNLYLMDLGSPETKGNYIVNSSFEECIYFGKPDYWLATRLWTTEKNVLREIHEQVVSGDAVHGKNALRTAWWRKTKPRGAARNLFQRGRSLDFSKNYVFSVYLKADRENLPVTLFFEEFRYKQTLCISKDITVGKKWQRYSMAIPLKDRGLTGMKEFQIALRVNTTGELFADCLQLEEGLEPTKYKLDSYRTIDLGPEYSKDKLLKESN